MATSKETSSQGSPPDEKETNVSGEKTDKKEGLDQKMSGFRQAITIVALLLSMFLVRFAIAVAPFQNRIAH